MSQAINYKQVLYTELKSNTLHVKYMTWHDMWNYKQIINVKSINNNIYITLRL